MARSGLNQLRSFRNFFSGLFYFFRAWVRNPREIGAIAPSSPMLSQVMATQINFAQPGYVIELGGGTGSLTEALLKTGLDPKRLIVIEQNPQFVSLLRKKFPQLRILEADAQKLKLVLEQADIQEINAIISGIPLRSLPKKILIKIIRQSLELLPAHCAFIQFTYGAKSPIPEKLVNPQQFDIKISERIWLNLPPARVWTYRKK